MEIMRKEDYTSETTVFIDYRKYLTDYSEKSYKLEFKRSSDNKVIKVFVPKSLVDDKGNIKLWFADRENIPHTAIFYNAPHVFYSDEEYYGRIIKSNLEILDSSTSSEEKKAVAKTNLEKLYPKAEKNRKKLEDHIEDLESRFEV